MRRYSVTVCPVHGIDGTEVEVTKGGSYCWKCDRDVEPQTVTAIDSRDVEPLVEAVRAFKKEAEARVASVFYELSEKPPERDESEKKLFAALATYEDGEGER
jgi:hypothetical protein